MNKKNLLKKIYYAVLFSTITCAPAFASGAVSQNCELGTTCTVPGNDGGQTHYIVTPQSGMNYRCELHSKGDSLGVFVSAGKDFKMLQGGGFYNANPDAAFEVKGRFDNPNDPNDQGEIKISHMPLTAEGDVKCYAIE